MRALIFNNQVVDVAENDFAVHSSMVWMDCTSECKIGWSLVDKVLTAPDEPPAITYDKLRRSEYPSIGDQLDALYHAGTFDSTMTATLNAVKDKYPKE